MCRSQRLLSGVSEAALMKKTLMVEAGDVFRAKKGMRSEEEMAEPKGRVVCWRGHGPQVDLLRSRTGCDGRCSGTRSEARILFLYLMPILIPLCPYKSIVRWP